MENIKPNIEEKYKNVDHETGLYACHYIPNYHSYLKPGRLHLIRYSTHLALLTFATEAKEHYAEANEMIRKVISCQCRSGECAGLWPYFYEESLEEMVAPDWNQADFNAYPLLVILKEHKDKLENGMYDIIKEACLYACGSTIRRKLTPLYTNPTVMGIYILAVSGELFDKPELVEHSRAKLRKFYFLTMKEGTYNEYNCGGGYTKLILDLYSLILRHVNDKDIIEKVTELNNLAWTMIGEHYHYQTGEFNGPKSREYSNFLGINLRSIYQRAISKGLEFAKKGEEVYNKECKDEIKSFFTNPNSVDLDYVYDIKCPEEIKGYFTNPNKETEFRKILSYGYNYPYLGWPLADTQYIKPEYTLGSFSGMDCWNQHLNVISYIGSREKKVCIRMRVYHDGYDFASAYMNTVQEKGTAMTLVNFHTDRGDTHHDLDKVIDAKIKAKDLRVRYQIEANVDEAINEIKIAEFENGCMVDAFGTPVEIKYHYVQISGEKPYFEVVKDGKSIYVDMVLYNGEEKEINLGELEELVTISSISVGEKQENSPVISKDTEFIYAKWSINGIDAEIKSPYKPQIQLTSVLGNEIKLNGKNLIQYIEDAN